jgi:hypothetical protein
MADIRPFKGPDGTRWGVEVKLPSSSRIMVMFYHPNGNTARLDRYAWYNWTGPESRSVTSRINPAAAVKKITDETLRLLFRRSAPVATGTTTYNSGF